MKNQEKTQDSKQVRAFGRKVAKELDVEKLNGVKGGLALAAGTISCSCCRADDCDSSLR